MKDVLVKSILLSTAEKLLVLLFQFFISIVLIRNLDREALGMLAIVGGGYAFLGLLNFPLENYLLKEKKEDLEAINDSFNQYLAFSVRKALVFAVLTFGAVAYVLAAGHSPEYVYALLSFFLIVAHDTLASPFIMLSGVLFKQGLNVRMSLVRWLLSLLLMAPLIFDPGLKWVMLKDLIVCFVSLALWFHYAKTRLNFFICWKKMDTEQIKNKFKHFTLWTHLTGSVTNVIYKADAVVLGIFAPLSMVGNYNIALNAGNVANLLPSLLSYQTALAISSTANIESANRLAVRFFRLTFYVSLLTFFAYLLLGKIYLNLLMGNGGNSEIYGYMINIVIGILIVKTVVSPLVAFINIKGSAKGLFLRVKFPLLILSLSNYALFAFLGGAQGISVANIVNALLWVVLIMLEIRHYHFRIKDIFNVKEDIKDILYYAKNLKLLH